MRFLNLTRQVEIGANSYAVEIGGKRIVLDCGMHPRRDGVDSLPDLTLIPDDSVDAVFVTHAHQDHIGAVPALMRRHPYARLFMTDATYQVGEVMLHNSVNVMQRIREERELPAYPLFTHREVDLMFKRSHGMPLRQRWSLEGERLGATEEETPSFEFYDAGHILGAAGVMIRGEGRSLFYTGDVNFEDQTLCSGAVFPEEPLDVLVMETTRGEFAPPEGFHRAAEEQRLAEAIAATFKRGGAVLMPVFALGKTQELLAMLHGMQQRGILPHRSPIYIGGLSAKLTELYDKLARRWPRLKPNLHLFNDVGPFVVNGREMEELPLKPRHIYALTSGMMTENTLSNLFAGRVLVQPKDSIFFIGYSDPDSPGGRLRATPRGECFQLDPAQQPCRVACEVQGFDFSAHANRNGLRAWVKRVTPKKIILVHGDPGSVEWFREQLSADLPQSEVIVALPGEPLEL